MQGALVDIMMMLALSGFMTPNAAWLLQEIRFRPLEERSFRAIAGCGKRPRRCGWFDADASAGGV